MRDTVAESAIFTKENSRILRKHYTALTGSNYVPHVQSVNEDSSEDNIGKDVDEILCYRYCKYIFYGFCSLSYNFRLLEMIKELVVYFKLDYCS